MKAIPVFKSIEGKNAILSVYDSLLEKWPIPCKKQFIKTRYGDTFIIECGDATMPPLVLIHGSSSNSAMWIGEVTIYCEYYHVYAVDIPGEPGKSQDVRLDLSTSAYVEWLDDVFTGLEIDNVSLIGNSLGGWMALKYSSAFPEKVDKLVLLCPSGIGPQKSSFILYSIVAMFLWKKGFEKIIKKVYGKADVPIEAIEYSKLISKNFNPYTGDVPLLNDEEIRHLTMPVQLIVGGEDTLLDSKKTAVRLLKLIPHAQINLLKDSGHVLVNLADKILPFLIEA